MGCVRPPQVPRFTPKVTRCGSPCSIDLDGPRIPQTEAALKPFGYFLTAEEEAVPAAVRQRSDVPGAQPRGPMDAVRPNIVSPTE
ncbi:unnamed protein product [Rangifer tarandus platyrhynchus]|uniref:Uncharacterized protein n=1 Tax=Rangifer tarandus platyrhynchus TaxID=3082113 RepID=A0AC59ZL58_RANTA